MIGGHVILPGAGRERRRVEAIVRLPGLEMSRGRTMVSAAILVRWEGVAALRGKGGDAIRSRGGGGGGSATGRRRRRLSFMATTSAKPTIINHLRLKKRGDHRMSASACAGNTVPGIPLPPAAAAGLGAAAAAAEVDIGGTPATITASALVRLHVLTARN